MNLDPGTRATLTRTAAGVHLEDLVAEAKTALAHKPHGLCFDFVVALGRLRVRMESMSCAERQAALTVAVLELAHLGWTEPAHPLNVGAGEVPGG